MKAIQCDMPVRWRRGNRTSTDRHLSRQLMDRLLQEISQLRCRLRELETGSRRYEYALQQTCRSMIRSREQLYRQISRTLRTA